MCEERYLLTGMVLRASLRRRLVCLRNTVPALAVTVGVCGGQVAAWFMSPLFLATIVCALGLGWAIGVPGRRDAVVGWLVGLALGGWEVVTHPSQVGGTDVAMLVQVEETPRRRLPGEVVFIGREVLASQGRLIRCRGVDLPWRNLSALEVGDIVWIRGQLLPISRPLNPFSWDAWMWRRGVSGEMKVLFGSLPVARMSSYLQRARARIVKEVSRVTEERRGGALFLSMAFGERDVLSPPVEALFTDLGLSHLLVVSGYQVSLVFGLTLTVLLGAGRFLRSSLGVRCVAIGASFGCAAVYVLTIGTEMSSVRALLAALCLCLSLLTQRRHYFVQRLVTTFLCMHLLWPWAMFEVGVMLTFAALAGIGIGSRIGGESRWRSIAWVTVSVWALTSLVTVVWSGTLSVSGLLLNLALAGPWSVLNCTAGVGGLALVFTGLPGAEMLLRAVGYSNEVIVSGLFWIHRAIGGSPELSPLQRGGIGMALFFASGALARAALRGDRVLSVRRMVQGPVGQAQKEVAMISSPTRGLEYR